MYLPNPKYVYAKYVNTKSQLHNLQKLHFWSAKASLSSQTSNFPQISSLTKNTYTYPKVRKNGKTFTWIWHLSTKNGPAINSSVVLALCQTCICQIPNMYLPNMWMPNPKYLICKTCTHSLNIYLPIIHLHNLNIFAKHVSAWYWPRGLASLHHPASPNPIHRRRGNSARIP